MADHLKLARPYMIALAIVTIGRWVLSLRQYPYEKGSDKFSIVILTMIAAVLYGAFAHRFRKYSILQAAGLGATLALLGQAVVLVSTLASYAMDKQTYFNSPLALGMRETPTLIVPFAAALTVRLGGLVVNVLVSAVLGAIGWAFGHTLPEDRAA